MPYFTFHNRMKFIFPILLEPYLIISTAQQLMVLLQQQLKQANLQGYVSYRVSYHYKKYIYARCKSCSARLSYMEDEDGQFRLHKSSRNHQHSRFLNRRQKILELIRDLPLSLDTKDIKEIVKKRFDICDSSFYRILNIARNKELSFKQLISNFADSNKLGYYQPLESDENKLPNMLICSSEKSRQAFQKYGEMISFDFTYNLFRQKSQRGNDYRLGIIGGLSGSMKLLPFAFVIVDDETTETIAKALYECFKLLGGKPKTIITDEQASIKAAINLLKYEDIYQGSHLFDTFHILRNIKKKLRMKKDLEYFKALITAKTANVFQKVYQKVRNELCESDREVLDQFCENHAQFVCYSRVPKQFIGFSVSSHIQKLNDMAKAMIPKSSTVLVVAQKLNQLFDGLVEKGQLECDFQLSKIQNFISNKEILSLKNVVCYKVYRHLIKQLNEATLCIVTSVTDQSHRVETEDGIEIVQEVDGIFVCSCGYQQKSGIPCSHLIKIILLSKRLIRPYISERWNCQKLIRVMRKEGSITMPRNTRRRK